MCYSGDMTTITVRQLRNDVSEIIRRAESGEEMTITVNGRPAARVVPLSRKPRTMPWEVFAEMMEHGAADRGLLDELAEILVDTTDDV